MTAPTSAWFADQPDRVRAVIEIAAMREAERDSCHDLVLQHFLDAHAETIREIWRLLQLVERCGSDHPVTLLNDHYGPRSGWGDVDARVEQLRAETQTQVLLNAQSVAALRSAFAAGAA